MEEPSVAFGGHYNILWPKNVLVEARFRGRRARAGAAAPTPLPFTENDPTYGKVYHTGNADKVQQLLDAENGIGITRTREPNPPPGSLMRPGAPNICRTIGISAWRSNRAWGRTTRNRRCVRGAASMPSTR